MGEAPCFAHFLDDEGRVPDPPRIRIRRAYGHVPEHDGEFRVLVDRVWPRGVKKDAAAIDRWARDLAPSTALRKWFAHDPARWEEFRRRYRFELAEKTDQLKELAELSQRGPLVLVYGARDEQRNQAAVLKEVLEEGIEHS